MSTFLTLISAQLYALSMTIMTIMTALADTGNTSKTLKRATDLICLFTFVKSTPKSGLTPSDSELATRNTLTLSRSTKRCTGTGNQKCDVFLLPLGNELPMGGMQCAIM